MEGFLLLAKGYKQLKILHLLPAVLEEQCHLLNKQRQLKTAMNLPPIQCTISLKLNIIHFCEFKYLNYSSQF